MKRYLLSLVLVLCASCAWAFPPGFMAVATWGGTTYTTIFSDNFTRSDSSTVGGGWTSETDSAGNLSISGNSLLWQDTTSNPAYVSKTLGSTYNDVQITFSINLTNTTVSNTSKYFQILYSSGNLIVRIHADGGPLAYFKVGLTNEAGSTVYTTYLPFTFVNGSTYPIIIKYKCASGAGQSNGSIDFSVNGSSLYTSTNLSNFGRGLDSVALGAPYVDNSNGDDNIDMHMYSFVFGAK